MTYPDPRYHGEGGEVSATFRAASQPPDFSIPTAVDVHYLARGETTGGDFGLYRWEMGPAPRGAEPHFHRTISESFFILSGAVRIFDGATWYEAGPNDFVYVPAGGIHAFKNESGAPASMLILFSPGAPREGYFENLPKLGSMTEAERADFFLRHDNIWV